MRWGPEALADPPAGCELGRGGLGPPASDGSHYSLLRSHSCMTVITRALDALLWLVSCQGQGAARGPM